jgi:hypothetical protein
MHGIVEYDKDPHDKKCLIISSFSVKEAMQHLGLSEQQLHDWKKEFIDDAIEHQDDLIKISLEIYRISV